MLVIAIAAAVAAAVSPLGIDVVTADGHRRLVPVADADATAVEVCAWHADSDVEPVCAPVVADRQGLSAAVNVDNSEDLRFTVRATRFDARTAAPAALAVGLGITSVGCVIGALAMGSVSTSVGTVLVSGAAPTTQDTADAAGAISVGLWLGAGTAAVLSGVATAVAIIDANVVE